MSFRTRCDHETRTVIITTPENKAYHFSLPDAEELRLTLTRAIWRLRSQVRADKKKAARSGGES